MTPWLLMLSASSYSEPSSMRVRGWYLPGWSCESLSTVGAPSRTAAAPGESPSFTRGPSNASRPSPRPLGFLVTMRVIVGPARAHASTAVYARRLLQRSACLILRPKQQRGGDEAHGLRRWPGGHDRVAHPRVSRATRRHRAA